jgi:hypothetical protein
MLPAPRQKQPQISPIFTADDVTIVASREKDGRMRIRRKEWDDYKVAEPDQVLELRVSSQGVEGRILPRRQGKR